jgi:hypothetical protein
VTSHAPVPPDDPSRALTVARPDHDEHLRHVGLVTFRGQTLLARRGEEQATFIQKVQSLAAVYKTELLPPATTAKGPE